MSEIYLTKIERKTIFTKSLIFVLIMFIISDLTVTGPFWFNFIPWMFLLGLLGSIKKIDGVLMSIIGTFTVFISSLIVEQSVNLICVINTVVSLMLLILGIVSGKLIFEFILEHRLVKYLRPSKKVIYIISMVIMLIISFVVVGLKDGNIITYLKSKNNLDNHIKTTYDITEYSISKTIYNAKLPGKYAYVVKVQNEEIYFVPATETIFNDVNKEERLQNINYNLEADMGIKVAKIFNEQDYTLLNNANITFLKEYTKMDVVPNQLVLYIDCTVEEKEQEELYKELEKFIQEVLTFDEKVDKVSISINNTSLELTEEKLENLTYAQIQGGFEVEELDEIH